MQSLHFLIQYHCAMNKQLEVNPQVSHFIRSEVYLHISQGIMVSYVESLRADEKEKKMLTSRG